LPPGGLAIERVNQVWCADVTYIPMAKGFLYLMATWIGSAARCWPGVSLTRSTPIFAVEALEEALSRYGRPKISIPTEAASSPVTTLPHPEAAWRHDQHGRQRPCMDNIFVEQLWRSLKYEEATSMLMRLLPKPRPVLAPGWTLQHRAPGPKPQLSYAAANLPGEPVEMWDDRRCRPDALPAPARKAEMLAFAKLAGLHLKKRLRLSHV
jgi:transposase InsO family protein